ncbi:MAG: preprotein translocase subunit YajC [Treponema sp.]|jgi:preprotein translocase subunit YajC|nr:preprotein translocase subunit YajC [Treponema sp.]
MNSFFSFLLMAGQQTGDGASGGPSQLVTSLLPFVAIIAIFYFLIIRPQSKKQKETQRMLSALKKGDRVVTIGGIRGTIQSVREGTVIIKVDDNVKIEFSRSAVSSVEAAAKEPEKIEEDKDEAPAKDGSA